MYAFLLDKGIRPTEADYDNLRKQSRNPYTQEEKMMQCDVLIIGAGPAGIFTALELLKRNSKKKIILVEKGKAIENRRCPKAQTGRCSARPVILPQAFPERAPFPTESFL